MNKHQNLNSVDLHNAAEALTAKVKGKEGLLRAERIQGHISVSVHTDCRVTLTALQNLSE